MTQSIYRTEGPSLKITLGGRAQGVNSGAAGGERKWTLTRAATWDSRKRSSHSQFSQVQFPAPGGAALRLGV